MTNDLKKLKQAVTACSVHSEYHYNIMRLDAFYGEVMCTRKDWTKQTELLNPSGIFSIMAMFGLYLDYIGLNSDKHCMMLYFSTMEPNEDEAGILVT